MRWIGTLMALAMACACTPGGGGGGGAGGAGEEPPECIAPEVVCDDGWQLVRAWHLSNADETNWGDFVARTWDDPTPPTDGARIESVKCAPPGEQSIDDFRLWEDMSIEQFGYYVTVAYWPDGSVAGVRESDEMGRAGFECEMDASRAYQTTYRPAGGEVVVTEFPQNLSNADGGGW